MMKKRLSKTIWYGSDVDSEGNPIVPPVAKDANDLEGLHHGELYLHQADDKMTIWSVSESNKVLPIGVIDEKPEILWEVRGTENGEKYIWTNYPVVTQQGVTMYADGSNLNLPSIYAGIPIDNQTIYWEEKEIEVTDEEGNVVTKVVKILKAKGVDDGSSSTMLGDLKNVGEWANAIATEDRIMVQKKDSDQWVSLSLKDLGTDSFENVKESGEGNVYTSFTLSDDKKTLTFVKGETFTKKADFDTLNTKVTDFLEGSDTDGIINKWKELESFLEGMKQSDDLATILATKWTKDDAKIANWDAAFSWGDHSKKGYALKTYVDETFVTIGTEQTITGKKNFTRGGLFVNGSQIVYDSTNGYWKLDGDLLVTGAVTMFANEGKYTPSTIMDAIAADNVNLKVINGILTFVGQTGGGVANSVAWENVTDKPSWIGSTKPSYTFSEIGSKPVTLSGYGITDAKISNGVITLGANTITPLTSHQTIYNLVFQAGAFSAKTFDPNGAEQTVNIPTKTSHLTNDSNFITSSYVDGKFVTITGSEDVTGVHDFTNGLKIGGIKMSKSQSGVVFLEGNLVVSGAVTMFGTDSVTASTVMDAVSVDGITIMNDGKKLYLNPNLDLGGGISSWDDLEGKPSWIGSSKPTYTFKEIASKPTTISGYGILDANISNGVITLGGNTITPLTQTTGDARYLLKDSKDYMKVNGSLTSNVDFDTYYTSGSYNNTTGNGSGNTNAPGNYGLMLVFGDKGGYAAQLHVGSSADSVKIRARYSHGGSMAWRGWNELVVSNYAHTITPSETDKYNLGSSSYQWSNLFAKKTTIDGISIYKSSTGVLRIDGDVVLSGALTMFGTDSVNTSTIMDGVNVDGTTIIKSGNKLMINPDLELGGGLDEAALASYLSSWAGSSSIKNVGTITSGTWNGSKIANAYLANSAVTISGESVSLGGSLSQAKLRTALGLGSNAYTSTSYLPSASYTAADVLAKLKTVDGSDSGLDADLLDGYHVSRFPLLNAVCGSSYDLNNADRAGYYNVSMSINRPSEAYGYGMMETIEVHTGVSDSEKRTLQVYYPHNVIANYKYYGMAVRMRNGASNATNNIWGDWRYFVTKDGNVASATTASKLATKRTIWGQSFDGSGDITGHLYLVGANASSSTGNTSQILFGTPSSHHLALSSNTNSLIVNPTSSSTTGQIVLGVNGRNSYFTSSGNFGIGTSTPTSKLHVAGNLLTTGGITMYGSSDKRLKKNIRTFQAGKELMSLGGVYQFEYEDEEINRNAMYKGTHVGLIYQNVKGTILDKMCYEREDGYGALNYLDSSFISLLAGVGVEHETRIQRLERENEELRKEIEQLKNK